MYVAFSAPMASGDAHSHSRVVEGPFVEIEPELWDPTGAHLTLLFDPGRIKRGLGDNEASAPPLIAGRAVIIDVDLAMRGVRGAPLAEKLTRTIRVIDAVREPVDVKFWRISALKSASDDLVITFPRPLGHALAQRAISNSRGGARRWQGCARRERDSIPLHAGVEVDDRRLKTSPAIGSARCSTSTPPTHSVDVGDRPRDHRMRRSGELRGALPSPAPPARSTE